MKQKDDAAGFLGVTMAKTEDDTLELKQTGLVHCILEAMGLDSNMATNKWTPADTKTLTKDEDEEGPSGTSSYSSVLAMLLYCSGHLCPDIAHDVNCFSRYMFNPILSHEKGLKRIGRYPKATRDKGLILEPTRMWKVDVYPNADFDGVYGHEKPADPTCAKSQTGFLINVSGAQWSGCPSYRER